MACLAILGFYLSCGLIAMSDAAATKVTLPMGVREEQPPGTFVGSVKEESDLSRKYDEAVLAKLKFRFLSQPSEGFIIEETTGVILTSGQVDREKICPHQVMKQWPICPQTFRKHPTRASLVLNIGIKQQHSCTTETYSMLRTHLKWSNARFKIILIGHLPNMYIIYISKQETLSHCWFNVGPPSTTLAQH